MDTQRAVRSDPAEMTAGGMAQPRKERTRRSGTKRVLLAMAAVVAVVVIFGLAWFEPWKLWTNTTVNEADPGAGAVLIAQGSFISHEHQTSGEVRVLRLADGTRILRMDRLDTSDGPVLKVWLSDAAVRDGKAGWQVFDDGKHIDLGRLKGNKGSQNYVIPQDLDIAAYGSVTIWCDRFHVSFGAAALTPTR